MRKYLNLFTTILLVAFLTALMPINKAQAAQSGDFTYIIDNSTATITNFTDEYRETVVIPSTLGGYKVTKIGDYAIYDCNMSKLIIPNTVTDIGEGAFASCGLITNITIPDSVINLGNGAFSSCINLTNVTLGSGLKYISDGMFYNCKKLNLSTIPNYIYSIGSEAFHGCAAITAISIGSNVKEIGERAFSKMDSLKQITVSSGNSYFSSQNGILFNKAKTTLIQYPGGKTDSSYIIPNFVITVDGFSFFGHSKNLISITLGSKVEDMDGIYRCGESVSEILVDSGNKNFSSQSGILFNKDKTDLLIYPKGKKGSAYAIPKGTLSLGRGAFSSNKYLTKVTIPNSITNIGSFAFEFTNLESIIIPDSVTVISEGIFLYCSKLSSVTISNSAYLIGAFAFNECTSLTYIDIPNSVKIIENQAFVNCNLSRIKIGSGLEYFGDFAFNNQTLTQVAVNSANPNFSTSNGILFNKDKSEILLYPSSKSGNTYAIPDTVKKIGRYAFLRSKINAVTIPNTVIDIDDYAFEACKNLNNLKLPSNLKTIGIRSFYECVSITEMNIPNSVMNIAEGAFLDCSGLMNVSIPANLTSIEEYAFAGCTVLKTISLPKQLKKIGQHSFSWCTALTSITIPENVIYIDDLAFYNCKKLTKVVFSGNAPKMGVQVFDIDDIADPTIYYRSDKTGFTSPKWYGYSSIKMDLPVAPSVKAYAGDRQVMLKWNKVAGASKYRIFSYDIINKKYSMITDTSDITHTITSLQNGTTYTYLIKAYNGVLWSNYSTADHVTAKPIAVPKPTATVGDGKVTLKWSAVTGATSYRIYLYDSATKKYSVIANTSNLTYTKTGLTNGKTYTFLVRAYNGVSWSAYSSANHVNAKPIAAPVVTAAAGDKQVTLKWGKVTGATSYGIYAYDTSAKSYKKLTTVTETSYTRTGLTNGKSYIYLVRAYNGVSWSAYTSANRITVKPIATPKPTATAGDGKVTLKWSKVMGAVTYRISRYDSTTKKYTVLGTTSNLSYSVTGLMNGKTYTFLVRAYNGVSWSALSIANHVTAKPIAAPKVTATPGNGKITLKWAKVTGATSYKILLYDTKTKTYTAVKSNVIATSYTISGLKNGTTYTYLVRAYNGVSWSAFTTANHVSATPKK